MRNVLQIMILCTALGSYERLCIASRLEMHKHVGTDPPGQMACSGTCRKADLFAACERNRVVVVVVVVAVVVVVIIIIVAVITIVVVPDCVRCT